MPRHQPGRASQEALGPNAWLVDEMYEQYLADPVVGERELAGVLRRLPARRPRPARTQADMRPAGQRRTRPPRSAASRRRPRPARGRTEAGAQRRSRQRRRAAGEPLRGAAARIVTNMEASLECPTATSFREVPAKLLEVNRKVINGYLGRTRGGKVSFTHLIGYAVVRAIADAVPVMNSTFVEGRRRQAARRPPRARRPRPRRRRREDATAAARLARAVHQATPTRSTSAGSGRAYEDLIRKVRTNKLAPDDFAGATVTLTNPGTIGTVQSVPRLMPGQGVIVGVGRLDYPTAFAGRRPRRRSPTWRVEGHDAHLHLRPPHHPGRRVRPVPQAGPRAAARRGRLLRATSSARSACPTRPCEWRRDVNPVDREQPMLEKQMHVQTLINMHRVRGHLIADLDPLAWKEPHMHPELDPATYGLTIWDLDREFLTDGLAGTATHAARRHPRRPPRRLLPHASASSTCTSRSPSEKHWIQEQVEGVDADARRPTSSATSSTGSTRPRRSRSSSAPSTSARSASASRAPSRAIPILDAILERAADRRRSTRRCSAWPTAAGSTCWPTSSASPTTSSSGSSRATSTPTPPRARAT